MDKHTKTLLPKPDFGKKSTVTSKSVFLTPSGMTLLPRKQPKPFISPTNTKNREKSCHEEKPEERQFCEPCEMEMRAEDFRRHRAQHEKCPVDGCKFKAHPSVMDKHVTELHASGIFAKIKKISTPEEIAAWREERRKKYPTVANTLMRKLAQEQRQKRGERLEANKSRFGHKDDRKRTRNIEQSTDKRSFHQLKEKSKHEKNNKFKDRRQHKKNDKPDETKSNPFKSTEKGNTAQNSLIVPIRMAMFEGTSKMKDYEHEKIKKLKSENALSGLLGMYGSDDESSVDEEKDNSIETNIISETLEVIHQTTVQDSEALKESTHTAPHAEGAVHPLKDPQSVTVRIESKQQTVNIHTTTETKQGPLIDIKANNEVINSCDINTVASLEAKIGNDNICYSSDEGPEEMPIERTTNIPKPTECTSTTNNLITECSTSKRAKLENGGKIQQTRRKYGLDYRKVRLRKQNTMLEKLLEPDIRHERNVLLQCVRFVCENNFFGIGSTSTAAEGTEKS